MQRRQLELYFGVKIYAESGGYVVVLPEGTKKFRFMADVEDYLVERAEMKSNETQKYINALNRLNDVIQNLVEITDNDKKILRDCNDDIDLLFYLVERYKNLNREINELRKANEMLKGARK